MSSSLSELLNTWQMLFGFATGIITFWVGIKATRTKAINKIHSYIIQWRLKKAYSKEKVIKIKKLQFKLLEYQLYHENQVKKRTAIDSLVQMEDIKSVKILAKFIGSKIPISPELYKYMINEFEKITHKLTILSSTESTN